MTEYTWALVAAFIAITAGVVLVAIRQTRKAAQAKREQLIEELLARARAATKQREKEEALKKARTASKKQEPILGVVHPKDTAKKKKKDTK
jgi:hypothetical protein